MLLQFTIKLYDEVVQGKEAIVNDKFIDLCSFIYDNQQSDWFIPIRDIWVLKS
jgi:hypothetical protein